MTIAIRPAKISNLDVIADLMLRDAKERYALDPVLWRLATDPRDKINSAVQSAMQAEAARGRHCNTANLVICPGAWTS